MFGHCSSSQHCGSTSSQLDNHSSQCHGIMANVIVYDMSVLQNCSRYWSFYPNCGKRVLTLYSVCTYSQMHICVHTHRINLNPTFVGGDWSLNFTGHVQISSPVLFTLFFVFFLFCFVFLSIILYALNMHRIHK